MKNVYSIVLDDNIVVAIDALALSRGVNRSSLINGLLAEAVSCVTPERSRRDAYEAIARQLTDSVLMRIRSPETTFALKSSLQYRYNPTMNYTLFLYCEDNGAGVFKATVRSNNPLLISALNEFYELWTELERQGDRAIEAYVRDGAYYRKLHPPNRLSADEAGMAIAEYVSLFDSLLKSFVQLYPDAVCRESLVRRYDALKAAGFPEL